MNYVVRITEDEHCLLRQSLLREVDRKANAFENDERLWDLFLSLYESRPGQRLVLSDEDIDRLYEAVHWHSQRLEGDRTRSEFRGGNFTDIMDKIFKRAHRTRRGVTTIAQFKKRERT